MVATNSSSNQDGTLPRRRMTATVHQSFRWRYLFHDKLVVSMAGITCLLMVACAFVFQATLFGDGFTIQGGLLGRKFDNSIKRMLFRWREAHFAQGMRLPPLQEQANIVGLPVLLHTHLYETITRAERRQQRQKENTTACWRHPLVDAWYRPLSTMYPSQDCVVSYTLSEMQQNLQELGFPRCVGRQISVTVTLAAIATLYQQGGAFLRQPHVQPKPLSMLPDFSFTNYLIVSPSPRENKLFCVLEQVRREWDKTNECSTMEQLELFLSKCNLGDPSVNVSVITSIPPSLDTGPLTASVNTLVESPPIANKITLLDSLREKQCWSGWLCNRCLRMPFWGSLDECRRLCRPCYQDIMCTSSDRDSTTNVPLQIDYPMNLHRSKRIPRIIHQTWFEDLTPERYPHLHRLQQGWKAFEGWEYRFYNDTVALEYVKHFFPRFVVDAYESILPGAFKADFFRLLVLLREGGIYADVDVSVDVHLDSFITPHLSFLVPRDVALDYWSDSNYCLWNGLMGAAPGHPIVVQAVQDVVNRILLRQDYLDIERDLCLEEGPSYPVWKLRSFPILLLTGPCALGMSMNKALGRPRLSGYDLGFQSAMEGGDMDLGDILILLADRYDLGELRFTDVDRNILVASTNANDFSKKPMGVSRQTPAHYSESECDIAGSERTYRDAVVTTGRVVLNARYAHL